jgi:CheY-like chemotaxis protein/HAMP domain-containing protein
MFRSLSIRIAAGFAFMVLLLVLIVVVTLRQVGEVRSANAQVEQVRMPVVQATVQLLNGVNHSSAALRGWIFLRDSSFRKEHADAWIIEIRPALTELQTSLSRSNDPTAGERYQKVAAMIDQLYTEQQAAANAESIRAAAAIITGRSAPAAVEARNVLEALVVKQRELMQADLDAVDASIDDMNTLQWVILVISFVVALILATITTRAIIRPVGAAVNVADNIAHGDLDSPVAIGGTRELETLGQALVSMRDSLKQRMIEVDRHNWLIEGQRLLDDVLRGEKELRSLSRDVIGAVAERTGAQVGALYMMDDTGTKMRLRGRYGLSEDLPEFFRKDEGLAGRAAEEKRPLQVRGTESTHLRIRSAFLDASPVHVVVYPLIFEDQVLGVIELARLQDFSPEDLEFLERSTKNIAIAINGAISRSKINELLEETQRQSEELQVQQEELQQTNEELEEQAERLKTQHEEIQVTNEELEEQTQAVVQRNEELEAARREVERKAEELEITSRYKSEFLANMSHELRTPLNSLLILSNHLAKNKQGNLKEDQVESAKVIAKSGYDLLNLINDILDLSKVEAGKLELKVQEVLVQDMVADIKDSFDHVAQEKGLSFNVVVEDAPERLRTDRQRLGQIVKNLVSNAIKFTNEGNITVTFRGYADDGVTIAVKDTGIGIPKDKQQLIFEAFQQVDGSTSRKFGGTGLGLSISRELARLLGGHITVQSTEGDGSTFTVFVPGNMPVKPSAPIEATNVQRPAPMPLPPPRNIPRPQRTEAGDRVILIIEDDATFAKVLADQARGRGFKTVIASTGEEGLQLVREYRPQAVMLDIDLPGMDGHTVLREIKGDPYLRHIPVHILSVNERSLGPIREGAVEYLEKPVTQQQLDEAFQRIEDLVKRKMKNLLIVEDNAEQRLAIKRLIGNGDVKCLEAATAMESLEMLKQFPIDCIVLDIGLPDASGFELLKLYKDRMGQHLPPIIVYTGKELSPEENDELRMYAETIIVKGIRSEERLLDETALFLHRAVKDLPQSKQAMIMDLHDPDAIFSGRTVLLVDDDMRNVFALNRVLESRDIKVLRAENGRVALETLKNNDDIDLVLMDIMMPEMDGYTAMRKIRQEKKWADLPIIALTAKAMKEDRTKCLDAGANDYISKPVDEARLFALMRIWIKERV